MSELPPELERAKQFHSHLGPYVTVGLRMGQAIIQRLGEIPFSLKIKAFTGSAPPVSCIVDGLQLSTPATV
ncbi:MAG: formylmethanofuran dehydrogenase subunit E family protein, partial [Candidatus Latescibacteria bacterium]|nr:formylmethanofuran dehydrogenase subunit E family protein [Candidatus Latescibacterota bacterium]